MAVIVTSRLPLTRMVAQGRLDDRSLEGGFLAALQFHANFGSKAPVEPR